MNRISKLAVSQALTNLGIAKGDNLFVHSDLLRLGFPADGPSMYLDVLKELIGVEGSIAAPAFTFSFMRTKKFHYKQTLPVSMGFITHQLMEQTAVLRTKHPLQSFVIDGPLADVFKRFEAKSAYSSDGYFAKLIENDVKILLLGASPSHISFSHLAEEHHKVPYREMLRVVGDVQFSQNDIRLGADFNFFARNLEDDVKLGGYDLLVTELLNEHRGRCIALGKCDLFFVKASDYIEHLNKKLSKNPYWLVDNYGV